MYNGIWAALFEQGSNSRRDSDASMIGPTLSSEIEQRVKELLDAHKAGVPLPESVDFFTDNFSEMVNKLCVLHIRVWFCENDMGEAHVRGDDAKIAEVKKKMDVLWKIKRPSLEAAINRLIDDAVIHGRSLREDSLKLYKGFEDAPNETMPYAQREFSKEERGKVL